MRFQGLAVVLAKKHWPDLIACERKKDKGADAIATASFAAEGTGKVLACSLTAELDKVRGDAGKVEAHFKDITKIIFATPSPVSNEKGQRWVEEIKKEFGFDLAIMSREDIVTSLMDPDNASLLRVHLRLTIDIEPDLADLVGQVREAADEVTATWYQRLAGMPLLELRALRLSPKGEDSTDLLLFSDFRTGLHHGERIVLEGPAGRGKTTTLIQLANAQADTQGTTFLIDLTAWTSTRSGILQFIAGMPQFQRRSLDASALARVNTTEHFSFLLNGWNEIGEPEFPHAESALRTLQRDFPAAGIIVATRTHHIVPPLPGATRARLLTLTRRERASYLRSRLSGRADELRLTLESDSVLDDLTRTPFFLSEVAALFEAGNDIPSTKIGVLEAVTRLVEQSDEHRNHLRQPPLTDRARDYLSELATCMTSQNAVTMAEDRARPSVAAVGRTLIEDGQIAARPDPGSVLATLCAHHVLERLDYPEVAFRFEHQQFQEFYAAAGIGKRLLALLPAAEHQKQLDFARSYLNEPAWAEPLRLLADDIRGRSQATDGANSVDAGSLLVTMALLADPIFAAELARLCGPHVWREVRVALSERLRSLYRSPDKNYKRLALAGMLASGSDDFKDIIEPMLSGDDEQGMLQMYRSWDEFQVSSLGPGWCETVGGWKEKARAALVWGILHHRNVPEVAAFALTDPSVKVKLAAVQGLCWIGAEYDAARFLTSLDGATFDEIMQHLGSDLVPVSLRDRAVAAQLRSHTRQTGPLDRLRTLLRLAELGAPDLVEKLKLDLASVTGKIGNDAAYLVIKPALDIVRATDAAWASDWIAERVGEGSLWHEPWGKQVSTVPEKLKEDLLHRLDNENFNNAPVGNIVAVLTAAADVPMARRVFARLCELRSIIANAPEERHEFEWAIERQLETLLRALPPDISVAGIASSFPKIDVTEVDVIIRVFNSVGRQEDDPFSQLSDTLRESLRSYLRSAIALVLQQDDFSGEMKANLGSVLASVGSAEDVNGLRELIRADIARVREGRAAHARGDRARLGNGGFMSYSNWHVRSLVRLDPANSEVVLLELLHEPEYERDVATELARQVEPPPAPDGIFRKTDYEQIWEARAGRLKEPNKDRRKRYSEALRNRVRALLKERSTAEQKKPFDFRLRVLGVSLAKIDGRGSADLICEVMSIPDDWDNYSRVEAFETLLFHGVVLPADATLTLLDSCLDRLRKYGLQQQDEGLVTRFLCLLPFVDDAPKGIERMRQLLSEVRVYGYHLREVLEALGHSRCDQALPFLLELGADEVRAQQFGEAWINAVAAIDTPDARDVLLSFVDPALPVLPAEVAFSRDGVLVTRLVALAGRDKAVEDRLFRLCDVELPPAKRDVLAKVVGQLSYLEAVSAGLSLIDDTASAPVPYEIWKQLENAFVERRPHSGSQNTFTLEPRSSNAIRVRLLEMARTDQRRLKSASMILAQIEAWRLEYGRPAGEPRHPAIESREPWPMTN